jgi:ketosteroid isomerase-like protein
MFQFDNGTEEWQRGEMMENKVNEERIRKAAEDLDKAVENRDVELVTSFFSDDCEIEMLGIVLEGREGSRKWVEWLFSTLPEIRFEPVTIMIEGNTFFEEFVINGKLKNGMTVRSKQAEVLIYEDYKVRNLRIYFDRLDFAEVIGDNPVKRALIKKIRNMSLEPLR